MPPSPNKFELVPLAWLQLAPTDKGLLVISDTSQLALPDPPPTAPPPVPPPPGTVVGRGVGVGVTGRGEGVGVTGLGVGVGVTGRGVGTGVGVVHPGPGYPPVHGVMALAVSVLPLTTLIV